jgi:hypothetical protein
LTIYYQHIGEVMWARDAPRSIGTSSAGLIHFSFRDIEPFLKELDAFELGSIERQSRKLAPTGFQIWGIPSGAHRVLEPMQTGDFLLLLESTDFAYADQVIYRVTQHCWDLSSHIWGGGTFSFDHFVKWRTYFILMDGIPRALWVCDKLPYARQYYALERQPYRIVSVENGGSFHRAASRDSRHKPVRPLTKDDLRPNRPVSPAGRTREIERSTGQT